MISGCINPAGQVPIVKVNITFIEKEGIAEAENYTITQGTVRYIARPRSTMAESFPAIAARATIMKGKNSSIGPWEALPYKGSGAYSFNLGFHDDHYPAPNNLVHISIMVVDKEGERIGYVTENIIWK
ncbi:MAG: hypothetical protein KKA10_02965 [Euryarchaeota archaeon]|nr:hypothetical protein [Euryarchaeota archaeon]MCG2738020.1 hypothetical protein [Candidatus Methanoperedenaceae archaeon]